VALEDLDLARVEPDRERDGDKPLGKLGPFPHRLRHVHEIRDGIELVAGHFVSGTREEVFHGVLNFDGINGIAERDF
jgi:hypothetical protein